MFYFTLCVYGNDWLRYKLSLHRLGKALDEGLVEAATRLSLGFWRRRLHRLIEIS